MDKFWENYNKWYEGALEEAFELFPEETEDTKRRIKMKVTSKMLEKMVDNLNKVLDRPQEAYSKNKIGKLSSNFGHLMLDQNSAGYSLTEMMNGGQKTLIERCSAKEMWHAINGIQVGIYMKKGGK